MKQKKKKQKTMQNPYQPTQQPQYFPPQQPQQFQPQQPQQPQYYQPQPPQQFQPHPGIQNAGMFNFDHVNNIDAEGGGRNLPPGTYWLRLLGCRMIQSKDPKKAGKSFLIVKNVVVRSLDPQSNMPPGFESGHAVDISNAIALARVFKSLLGLISGVSANAIVGSMIGQVVQNPAILKDYVVQVVVEKTRNEKGQEYDRWTPVALVPDEEVAKLLAQFPSLRPQVFPDGLRSEQQVPSAAQAFGVNAQQPQQHAPMAPPMQQQPQPQQQAPQYVQPPWQQPQQVPVQQWPPAQPPQQQPWAQTPGVVPPTPMSPPTMLQPPYSGG